MELVYLPVEAENFLLDASELYSRTHPRMNVQHSRKCTEPLPGFPGVLTIDFEFIQQESTVMCHFDCSLTFEEELSQSEQEQAISRVMSELEQILKNLFCGNIESTVPEYNGQLHSFSITITCF